MMPPSSGPSAGPTITPSEKIPWAFPCSCGGYVSRRIACEVEINPPPPIPWISRQKTSEPKLPAKPHITDATVKIPMEAR